MIAVGLVFYVFSMFGLAYIVGHAAISRPIREWIAEIGFTGGSPIIAALARLVLALIECPACFGFWSGVVMTLIGSVPFDVRFSAIAWALFTSGTNYVIARITGLMD